jgi:osmoprotectant transport system permease protein
MRRVVVIACLLLAMLAARRSAACTVTVGSKRFTESYILAEVAAAEVRRAGECDAKHTQGLGGTVIVWQALLEGSIDLYVEYTGTIGEAILHEPARELSAIREKLRARGIGVLWPLGFANDYALVVSRSAARTGAIRTISDLKNYPEVTFGFSNEFIGRTDGWPGLARTYGIDRSPRGMDHGLAYDALRSGSIDVTDAYTTDAKLERYGFRALADDKGFFPSYEAVILHRADLETRAPATFRMLSNLSGRIDQATMTRLNALAEIDGHSFADVGTTFSSELHGGSANVVLPARPGFVKGTLEVIVHEGPRHLFLVFLSLFAAALAGVPLGIVAHRRKRIGAVVMSLTGTLQTIPSLAMLAFFVPLFGIGMWPALVALFAYGLLPIVRNTLVGLEEVPVLLREVAEVMGLSPSARLRLVELPLASRTIVAGIKTSAIINVGTATIAAFVGAGGFGEPISTGLNLGDATMVLEGAVPAALLALLVQGAFAWIERIAIPRGLRNPSAA